ncbi:MAG: hypothetical protein JNM07_11915 [Phycisphaerae bacterium]|nr:hypothetical protein [Phycisphaerae bacterium]
MSIEVITQLAWGAVAPGLLGLIAFLAVWWSRAPARSGAGGRARSIFRAAAGTAVLAMGYAAMHRLVLGRTAFPPARSDEWFPVAALVFMLLAHGVYAPGARPLVRWIMMGLLVAAAGWASASNLFRTWEAAPIVAHLALFAAGATLAVACLDGVASSGSQGAEAQQGNVRGVLALLIFAVGAHQLLTIGCHTMKLGQVPQIIGAMCGGAALVWLFRRGLTFAGGPAATGAAVVCLALFQGVLFTDAPLAWLYATLAVLSPVCFACAGVLTARRWPGFKGGLAQSVAAALPITTGMAVALATAGAPEE